MLQRTHKVTLAGTRPSVLPLCSAHAAPRAGASAALLLRRCLGIVAAPSSFDRCCTTAGLSSSSSSHSSSLETAPPPPPPPPPPPRPRDRHGDGSGGDGGSGGDHDGARRGAAASLLLLLVLSLGACLITPGTALAAASSSSSSSNKKGKKKRGQDQDGDGGGGDWWRAFGIAGVVSAAAGSSGSGGGHGIRRAELDAFAGGMLEMWRPTAANFCVSGAMGACAAAALKAAGRGLAGAVGLTFVALQALTYTGVITVDWTRVHDRARALLDACGDGRRLDADAVRAKAKRALVVLSQGLPSASGFVAGFALGLQLF